MSKIKLQKDKKATYAVTILFILCLSLAVLPLRIVWGEVENFSNLIASQTALFFMCLAIWYLLSGILQYEGIPYIGLKIFTGMLMAGTVSIVSLYIYIYI